MTAGPPPAAAAALRRLRDEAAARYRTPLLDLELTGAGVRGTVGLPAQAAGVRAALAVAWPGAPVELRVLSQRRPRCGCHPQAPALDIWRQPPVAGGPPPERATQLLPGDPPADLLAVRGGACLVRAPGDALGWVARDQAWRLGPRLTPEALGLRVVRPGEPVAGAVDWPVVRARALAAVGLPYRWGGTGGGGVDCSGLVWRAFLAAGVCLPRHSRAQRACGQRIPVDAVRAGDLVAAVYRGPRRTSHVGLALDAGTVLHACSALGQVRIEPRADFEERYQVLAWRRIGDLAGGG